MTAKPKTFTPKTALRSALGQKQTYTLHQPMSALPPKADMCSALGYVCFGPKADMADDDDRSGSNAPVRGKTTLISVNSPGCVSTSIEPPCCLTTMSWLMERPSPVPSPAGFVVKNGLNIFSFTSGGTPVPLSRIVISTRSPRFLVAAVSVGS